MANTLRWDGKLRKPAKFGGQFDKCTVLFSLCLIFGVLQPRQADAQPQAAYSNVPANLKVLACSDPDQQAECKINFAGFAHTLDLIIATDPKGATGDGLCGDITDLMYEFANEVQTNPKARSARTPAVLAAVLIRDHNCAKLKGQSRIQNNVSAGDLIDMCNAGDIGFNLCSEYEAGFISAVLFVSETTGNPILCGDQRVLNPVSVATMLHDGLQANFRLRRDPAVAVMLDELKAKMPCPSK
jgi:hypothetical protein